MNQGSTVKVIRVNQGSTVKGDQVGLKVDTAIRFVQTVHQHFLDLILFCFW